MFFQPINLEILPFTREQVVNQYLCDHICLQAVFRAFGNLGDVYVCRGDFPGAVKFYQQQLTLAQKVSDQKMEADAFSALGSVHR